MLLLPGLGADTRMFDPLRNAGVDVDTPPFIDPRRGESLAGYAARLAATLTDPPPVIGGASFGGMIALEMARHLRPHRIVLLGSCTHPSRLAPTARLLERVARPLPDALVRALIHSQVGIGRLGPMDRATRRSLATMVRQTPLSFIRWGIRAIMTWPGCDVASLGAEVVQIHGECDRIIRPPAQPHAHILPAAGHVFPMTHPAEVAAILRPAARP